MYKEKEEEKRKIKTGQRTIKIKILVYNWRHPHLMFSYFLTSKLSRKMVRRLICVRTENVCAVALHAHFFMTYYMQK